MKNNNTKINILPQNIEAERALLCSLTLDNSQIPIVIEQKLKPLDFYDNRNNILFGVIIELYKENVMPDLIAITNKLKELDLSNQVDYNYIIGLINYLPAPTNAKHYTEIIKDKATKRKYLSFSEQISLLIEEGVDIKEIKKIAEDMFFDNNDDITSNDIPFSELVKDKKEIIETFAHGIKIQNGIIFGLVGATSVGKTEYALDVAGAYTKESLGNTVLFCEYEGNKQDFIQRITAKKEYPIDENSIYLQKPNFLQMIANIRKYKNQNILIVIDYLQRFARKLQAEDKHATDSLRFYVNKIYNFFDNLRVEYPNISVCFLSSLSKSGINEIRSQSKADRISLLNGIKESGDVQYDLDYAYAMLFSDEIKGKLSLSRFNNDTGKPRRYMNAIVIKPNRTGEVITDGVYTFNAEEHCYNLVEDYIDYQKDNATENEVVGGKING